MIPEQTRKVHQLDATEQVVGRLASVIAGLLMGKHKPEFVAHTDVGDSVEVNNVDKMLVTGKKMEQKEYIHHTHFPGGLRRESLKKVWETDGPAEVLRRSVQNMLPKNKLQTERMKRLIIK